MKPVLLTDKTHSLVKKSAVAQGVNMSALADDILAKGLAPKKPAKKAKP